MRRWIAVLWHASFLVIAGALYFFFVLPRWLELTGHWGFPLGLSMRIVCGALIGLAALPVVFTLLRTRRPEFGTPQLALSLRLWSIVLHVLAGVLIIGAAVSEIWFSLDRAGAYLFGVYGAAAAIALLGALGFYLAFAAELPPPPPKPLKASARTSRRGRRTAGADDEIDADTDTDTAADEALSDENGTDGAPVDLTKKSTAPEATEPEAPADPVVEEPVVEKLDEETVVQPAPADTPEPAPGTTNGNGIGNAEDSDADEPGNNVRNRRPGGKQTSRLFGRSRRGVALDD